MAGDVISKIKERIDIVDLISGYLRLQKSGVNYKARCPFHNEKTASFYISPERQIWHCFGCSAGGDAFGFVKQIEGVEFPEALRTLAARAGVELEPYNPEYRQFQSAKTKLYEICELASKFFEKQLWESSNGQQALNYLHDRGLTDQSIKSFRLGFAPDSWNALSDFLQKRYQTSETVSAGLAIKKDSGGHYDRFRSRIMFPIFDLNGQIVGFSARIFELSSGASTSSNEGGAKYVNTPQTLIYDKGRILYGLDRAKLGVRQQNRCLMVEGNMDVIMSHQASVTNAVATSGTALTDSQLKIIKRYTDNLDLCFDSDSAGEMATSRGVDLALARGFNVGIVSIAEADIKDPADYVKKYGAGWAQYASTSRPFMEFFFDSTKKKFDLATALGKKLLTEKLLPFVAAMASKVEQAHWVSEIALVLKMKEDILYQELTAVKPKVIEPQGYNEPETKGQLPSDLEKLETNKNRLSMLEETLISLLVRQPELAARINPENEIYLSIHCRELIQKIAAAEERFEFDDQGKIITRLAGQIEPALKISLDIIYLKAQELWKDFEDVEISREFDKLLSQAKKHYVSAQLEKLEYDIKSAEKNQDKTLLARLMADFSKISKELGN